MRILFIGVNPKDVPQLRLQEEINIIKDILERDPEHFQLRVRDAANKQSMINYLQAFEPDILHISGHGNDDQTLVFEDSQGYSEHIYINQLGDLLDNFDSHLKCVILSACYSLNEIEKFSEKIPYVVGMNTKIPNSMAKEFTQTFYGTLINTNDIERSFLVAKDTINLGMRRDLDILKIQMNGTQFSYNHKSSIKQQGKRVALDWRLVIGIIAIIIVTGYLLINFFILEF